MYAVNILLSKYDKIEYGDIIFSSWNLYTQVNKQYVEINYEYNADNKMKQNCN